MSITFEALGSGGAIDGATLYGGSAGPVFTGSSIFGLTFYSGFAGVDGGIAIGETIYGGSMLPNGFMAGSHIYDGRMPLAVSIQVPGSADGGYIYDGDGKTGGYFRLNPGAQDIASGYRYGGTARSFTAGGFMEGATGYVATFDRPRQLADTAIFTVFTRAYAVAGVSRDVVYEALHIGLTQRLLEGLRLDENFFFGSLVPTSVESEYYVQDDFRVGGRLSALLLLLLNDGLVLGSSVNADYRAIARARDALLLGGVVNSEAEADEAITLAILLGARTDALFRERLAEIVALGTTFADQYAAVSAFVEGVRLNDTATPSAVALFFAEERVAFGASAATAAEFTAQLRESVRAAVRLNLESGEFVAWTINSESKHLSSYTQFPVNGLAQFAGRALASLDDGIYDLDGPDDAGQPIPAKLRFAMTDLGAARMKRLDAAYLGFSASGQLLLKVVHTTEAGGKVAYAYRMVPRQQNVTSEGRVKFGQGVQSMYWGFELHNVNGSDFELESVEVRELVLDRRVRGSGRRGAP